VKKLLLLLGLLAVIVGVMYVFRSEKSVLNLPEKTISLIVVDSNPERERGLSGREKLADDSAMLFVFDAVDDHTFWMKEMKFPIDIIWLDETFKVVHIESDVSPATYPEIFSSPEKSRYVLETNAHFSRENNIKIGDILGIVLH